MTRRRSQPSPRQASQSPRGRTQCAFRSWSSAPLFYPASVPSSDRSLETSLPLEAHLPLPLPRVLLSSILIKSVCSSASTSRQLLLLPGNLPAAWHSPRFRCPSFFRHIDPRAASTPPGGLTLIEGSIADQKTRVFPFAPGTGHSCSSSRLRRPTQPERSRWLPHLFRSSRPAAHRRHITISLGEFHRCERTGGPGCGLLCPRLGDIKLVH